MTSASQPCEWVALRVEALLTTFPAHLAMHCETRIHVVGNTCGSMCSVRAHTVPTRQGQQGCCTRRRTYLSCLALPSQPPRGCAWPNCPPQSLGGRPGIRRRSPCSEILGQEPPQSALQSTYRRWWCLPSCCGDLEYWTCGCAHWRACVRAYRVCVRGHAHSAWAGVHVYRPGTTWTPRPLSCSSCP